MNACWSGLSAPSSTRPSTVRTARPSASTARYVQALTAQVVDQDGACAADLGVARDLGAGQAEAVAQDVGERLARLDPERPLDGR